MKVAITSTGATMDSPVRIPDEVCHRFHSKAATHSTASLPLIPHESCHRFR